MDHTRRPRLRTAVVAALAALAALAVASPAQAAPALTVVTGFGSNPGNLTMYSYRPAGLPAGSPLVVALHGCTQTAQDYFDHAGWPKYADLWHFELVFAEQKSANNANSCFNWFATGDTARGQGEALSIKQMVDYALAHDGVDPGRVFVTGLSAGGAMTSVMLATYPDVFRGGAVIAGIAYRCATDLTSGLTCMSSPPSRTPQQWGDLVRNAVPGYGGPYPRVQIWYGTSDTTVQPANAPAQRDQWTNVWGVSQTPTRTATLAGGTQVQEYDAGGAPAVSVYAVPSIGHGTPVDPGSATEQCGTAGQFYPDSICSTYVIATRWGLNATAPAPSGPPAPTGLTVTGVGSTSVDLSWSAVTGAAGYHVYRDGTRITGSPTTATSWHDTGLTAGTSYGYTVSAVDAGGAEGPRSGAVTATTTGSAPVCVTTNNYQHTVAGRAYQMLGMTYARGSNQAMGLWNVAIIHTLRQTGPDFWVIADGAC